MPDFSIKTDQALAHLEYLGGAGAVHTFVALPERPGTLGAPWQRSGTFKTHEDKIQELQNAGYGIFTAASRMDGTGRRQKKNVREIQCIWQEADKTGARTDLPLEPHFVVESSPGKYHRYLLTESLTETTFDGLMSVMVDQYDSDPNAKDTTRVLRLAGTWHQKATPHLVTIVEEGFVAEMCGRYSSEALIGAFGPLPERKQTPTLEASDENPDEIAHLKNVLKHVNADDRGTWRDVGYALHHHTKGGAEGFALWDTWSSSSAKYQADAADTSAMWDSMDADRDGGVRINTLYKFAYAGGFKGAVWQDAGKVGEGFEPVPLELREPDKKLDSGEDDDDYFFDYPTEEEARAIPPLPRIINKFVTRGMVSTLVAPGAVGKSLLTLQMAVAIGIGDGRMLGMDVRQQTKCMVINLEDTADILRMRAAAIFKHNYTHGGMLTEAHRAMVKDNVKFKGSKSKLGARQSKFRVMSRFKGVPTRNDKEIARLKRVLKKNRIGVLFVDPFIGTHGLSENDNNDMEQVMDVYREIAIECNCSVYLVHHSKKPQGASAEGHAGNADSARGASAVVNASRIVHTLYTMTDKDAAKYKISPMEKNRYIRLDDAKTNYSLASASSMWFKKITIMLENGEEVGILDYVELYEAVEQTGEELLMSFASSLSEEPMSLYTLAKLILASPMHADDKPVSQTTMVRRLKDVFESKRIVYGQGFELEFDGDSKIKRTENRTVTAH